jgi:hypothetical protein
MRLKSKKLRIVLESSDELLPDESTLVEVIDMDLSDLNEPANYLEEITNSSEEANIDINSLCEIEKVMEETVIAGQGIDPQSAEMTEIALESIMNRLGIKKTERLMPSLESFNNVNTRVISTKIAIEGINDLITRILTAIKEAINNSIKLIKDFYNSFLKKNKEVSDKLKSLLTKLKEDISDNNVSTEDMNESRKIEDKHLISAFNIKGKANSETIFTILDNQTKLHNTGMDYVKFLSDIDNVVKKMIDNQKGDLSSINKLANKFSSITKIDSSVIVKHEDNIDSFKFAPIIGGKSYTFHLERDESFGFSIKVTSDIEEPIEDTSIDKPTRKNAITMVELAFALVDNMNEKENEAKTIEKNNYELIKIVDSAIKKYRESNDSDTKDLIMDIQKLSKTAQVLTNFITVQLNRDNIYLAQVIFNYASTILYS